MLTGGPAPRVAHATLVEALDATEGRAAVRLVGPDEREQVVPWPEVRTRARRFAAGLAREGVRPHDRVVLVLPTGLDFLDAFFGALVLGAVPVPVYPPVRLGRLEEYHAATARMITAVGARVVISDARVSRLLGVALERSRPPLGLRTAASLMAESDDACPPPPPPDALALIQFSSGSTVDPKPVMLTHAHVLSQCAMVSAFIPEPGNPDAAGVSWLPLYHDMGLIGGLLTALYHRGNIVLIPPEQFLARPALWLRAIGRHRAIISPAPNFAYAVAAQRIKDQELEGVDLSSWRFALCGAEPVSAAVLRRFAERFSRFGFDHRALMPVYGLAEAALAVTFPPSARPLRTASVDADALAERGRAEPGTRELVSVGAPVPGVEVVVRKERGDEAADGEIGAVYVRGPAVMLGYYGRPELTRATLSDDGWLATGDLGFVSGGELYVTGRSKDVIAIRGAKRAPQEIEELLDALPGVRQGCAVAVGYLPADADGESLLLLVERKGAGEEIPDDALVVQIRDVVTALVGIKPHRVVLLAPGTLPRTSSGKLRRSEALARFLAGTLEPPRPVNALSMVREVARSTLARLRTGPGAG